MQKLKIIKIKNPLDLRDREIFKVPYTGQNISDIVKEYAADLEQVVILVNGQRLEPVEKEIYNFELFPDDEIILNPAIKDPVSAIVSVASWIAEAAGYTSFWAFAASTAIQFGISIGVAYLIRAIGGSPDDADINSSPSYGWSPVTIQRQGTPIPRAYGTNKMYGNIINGWRSPDGLDETLNLLIAFAEGPEFGAVADTTFINGQPADNYEDVTTYEKEGTMNQTAIFSTLKNEYQPEIEVIYEDGPQTWTTLDNDFNWLEIAVKYSGHYVHKDGGRETQYVGVKIELSVHGAESWTTLVNELLACSDSPAQKNYVTTGTYTGGGPVSITKGTRVDIKVTKTNAGRVWDGNRKSRYLWLTTVREVINTAYTYPGLSLLGVDALATENLSGSIQISQIRKGRICNVYNGSSWTLQWTENPAWIIWDIMTQPVISGDGGGTAYAIERYDGISPDRLLDYLDDWLEAADYFDALITDGEGGTQKRITFNGVFDTPLNIWDAVNKVCAIARCEVLRIGRNYTILVDMPYDGDAVQLFSAGNIIPGTYRKNYIDMDERASELQIDFQDKDLDYEMSPMVHIESTIGTDQPKTIEGFGITRASQAWRAVYYELQKNKIYKYMPTFEVDIDAIACKKGDVVLVVEPWLLGGRIVSCDANNKVTLETPPAISAADTIAIRMYNPATGSDAVETHTVSSVTGSQVTITDTWTITPKPDDLYAFGPTSKIIKKFRVVGITDSGEI